ncbi:MAG: hypothetical protein COT91_00465 [Candidatus Doudnabacteria bacterium CG10_big_fil_rev_8_21_14_0_10_41_10]|uniref:Glycosyltransferase family 1 protein n=1 Tax=Candidatus Doudnabacteria bacterium CG10_big_fil_rev_8_21_14_0_10_41_10 TaxID=1974551 RepID=A0A2H0VEU7_9BACT|nr:MAG: hypothetical protein COT91_00465 [Candidatus Doudnabacteria bacterium CG10_big_fil_rev_8_21_14_0_10_41_10]
MNTSGQQIKILYIVTQGNWGGAQKYVFDMSKSVSVDYSVVVASGIENDTLGKKITDQGIKYVGLKHLVRNINPIKDFKAIKEIANLIKKERPDVVHLNSSKAGVLGSIAAQSADVKKVIFTMHGLVLNEPLNPVKKLIYLIAERLSARFTDELIAVSEKDKQSAIKYAVKSAKHISVIHIGIGLKSLEFFPKDKARLELGLDPNKTIVGTIADFYPAKGLPYLIDAAKKLIAEKPDLQFVLIGRSGPDKKKIKLLAEKLGDKFIIRENLDQASQYLKAFDIFVLPSVKEGLPYTILEAMAAGLPIVATKVSGVPDVLEHERSALLVEPANSDKLVDSIHLLLSSEQLINTLSTNAKNRVADFSLDKMVAETKNIYHP